MAPARMVQFIKQHVAGCSVCQEDTEIQDEIVKITEVILPESKIPKAVRLKQEQEDALYDDDEEDDEEATDDTDSEEEDDFVDDDDTDEEPLSPEDEDF